MHSWALLVGLGERGDGSGHISLALPELGEGQRRTHILGRQRGGLLDGALGPLALAKPGGSTRGQQWGLHILGEAPAVGVGDAQRRVILAHFQEQRSGSRQLRSRGALVLLQALERGPARLACGRGLGRCEALGGQRVGTQLEPRRRLRPRPARAARPPAISRRGGFRAGRTCGSAGAGAGAVAGALAEALAGTVAGSGGSSGGGAESPGGSSRAWARARVRGIRGAGPLQRLALGVAVQGKELLDVGGHLRGSGDLGLTAHRLDGVGEDLEAVEARVRLAVRAR